MRQVMERQTLFDAGDLIRKHCHKDENGFAVYDTPWTDKLMAEHLAKTHSEVNIGHVTRLRVTLVGQLKEIFNKDKTARLESKVEKLEALVQELMSWAGERPVAPFGKESKQNIMLVKQKHPIGEMRT